MSIIIDAGHGGKDPGAFNKNFLYRESFYTLSAALQLKNFLDLEKIETIMTRRLDEYVTLSDRVSISNNVLSAEFISIHANAFKSETAKGMEIFYKSGCSESMTLAQKVAEHIHSTYIRKFPIVFRGVKPGNFFVLRKNKHPAILIESGFITNPKNVLDLMNDEAEYLLFKSVANGVISYKREKNE